MSDEQERTAEELESAEAKSPPEDAEEDLDELTALSRELEEARKKEAEYLDGWQRARAELANARKRFQREQQQAYTNAQADILARLLPVVDDFERAIETLPDNLLGLTWTEGVVLIQRKLALLLEQAGVGTIDAVGQEFDPFSHEAVTHEPSGDIPDGHVISELQKGYRMGDRVLRPSMARVSSGEPHSGEPHSGEPQSLKPGSVPTEGEPAVAPSGSEQAQST